MRFKAKIDNLGACLALQSLVGTLSRLSKVKRCLLKLTPTHMYFTFEPTAVENEMRVWAAVKQEEIFYSYKLESLHPNKEIAMETDLDFLSRALKSCATAQNVTLKLSSRDESCYLIFTIGTITSAGTSRPIVHEIPVRMYHHADVDTIAEPEFPIPDVSIYLPPVKVLKSVVDAMKQMSDYLVLHANNTGDLCLEIDAPMVSVKTSYNNLENAGRPDGQAAEDDPSQFVVARVDIRRVAQFLSAQQFRDSLLLSMSRKSVMFFCVEEAIQITCLVPMHRE